MTQLANLQKLLTLRQSRLERAEGELARQLVRCERARAECDAANARVMAHSDRQRDRERELLAALVGRQATVAEIERIRLTFSILDEQRADLEQDERNARRVMAAANEVKHALANERDHRRRETDKTSALVSHMARTALRRHDVLAEVEQDESVCSSPRVFGRAD